MPSLAEQIRAAQARMAQQYQPSGPSPAAAPQLGVVRSPFAGFRGPVQAAGPPQAPPMGGPRSRSQEDVKRYISEHNKYALQLREFEQQRAKLNNSSWGQKLARGTLGVVSKPFELLDPARRAVITGMQEWDKISPEWLDVATAPLNPIPLLMDENSESAQRGIMERIKDPTHGFGDAAHSTGSKWVDRGVGFVGDVAMDPLTYVTAGSGRFAGALGRADLVRKVNRMDDATKAALGVTDNTIRDAGRLGISSMSDALRRELGDQAGLRFMGARLPGSERVMAPIARGGARARSAIGNTGLGKFREIEQIADAMATVAGRKAGQKSAREVANAADRIFAFKHEGVGRGLIASPFEKRVDEIAKMKIDERRAITHAAEKGEQNVAKEISDDLYDLVSPTVTGMQRRSNYVMHLPKNAKARRALKNIQKQGSDEFVSNAAESTGRAFGRVFEPGGTYTVTKEMRDGTLKQFDVTLGDASIDDINTKFGDVLDLQLLEDDYLKIAQVQIASTAEDFGRAYGQQVLAREGADDFGFAGDHLQIAEREGKPLVDRVATSANRRDNPMNDLLAEQQANVNAMRQQRRNIADPEGQLQSNVAFGGRGNLMESAGESGGVVPREIANIKQSLEQRLKGIIDEATAQADAPRLDLDSIKVDEVVEVAPDSLNNPNVWHDTRDPKLGGAGAPPNARGMDALVPGHRTNLGKGERLSDSDYLDELGYSMRTQGQRDPIEIHKQPDGSWWIGEGNHRLAAAMREGLPTVKVKRGHDMVTMNRSQNDIFGVVKGGELPGRAAAAMLGGPPPSVTPQAIQQRIGWANDQISRLRQVDPDRVGHWEQAVKDLQDISAEVARDSSAPMRYTQAQLADIEYRVGRLTELKDDIDTAVWTKNGVREVYHENSRVFKKRLEDDYNRMADELFAADDPMAVVARNDAEKYFTRVVKAMDDNSLFDVVEEYTKLFKAWATAKPGFHLRNAQSAIFMNFVAGVDGKAHFDALRIHSRLRKEGQSYIDELAEEGGDVYQAVLAGYGSGMGGRVGAGEIGQIGGRDIPVGNKLGNNFWLRWNKSMGEWVEGPVRLAQALHTIRQGGDVSSAITRISRYHFNYSHLSKFDRSMKFVIPFWTFMSRSLPLQLQEMVMRPGRYAALHHGFRNMTAEDAEGDMPQWMQAAGGFLVGDNQALVPDYPHMDVGEQLGYFGFNTSNPDEPMWDARNMLGVLSNTNPIGRVPVEIAMGHKFFGDRPFYDDESKFLYALQNLLPGANDMERLSGGGLSAAVTGEANAARKQKLAQTLANWVGVPWKDLTPVDYGD